MGMEAARDGNPPSPVSLAPQLWYSPTSQISKFLSKILNGRSIPQHTRSFSPLSIYLQTPSVWMCIVNLSFLLVRVHRLGCTSDASFRDE